MVVQRAQLKDVTSRLLEFPKFPQSGDRVSWLLGRGTPAGDREAFFVWQERALDLLLAWGVGNVVAGSVLAVSGSGITRAIGIQAIFWGSVETTVALYSEYWARKHAVEARAGMLGAQAIQDEAERFEYFLALNTAADIVYVLGGVTVAIKSEHPRWRGAAIGVAIQGGVLLIYDLVLTVRTILRPETHFRRTAFD
ncbi:hypothetical protein BH24CHL1_BH24CHL1_08880 [soil metagenome]